MNQCRVIYSYTIEDSIVCIVDSDQGMSVTNGIEHVISELRAAGVDLTLPVIYRDSMGVWDEVLIDNGYFRDFRSLGHRDKQKAKQRIKNYR